MLGRLDRSADRMKANLILVIVLLSLPLVTAETRDDVRLRAVYGVWNYSLLADLGFEVVYQEVWWTEGAEEALELFANESAKAAAQGLSLVCGPYYEVTVPDFNYSRAVNANGHIESATPSRVDETYWTRLVEESGIAIANLSLTHDIWGVVWDIEDYKREEFTYWDYTFDRAALEKFAEERDTSIPDLPASERYDWLQSRGLLEEFQSWQEETVTRLARRTEQRIHAINPNLSLGILAFEDESWFHLSILKGLSTPERPVTAWHEDTYSGYKKGKIDDNHAVFQELGINGKVLPGLWTLWIPPFEILDQLEYANRHNGAYWIYQRATNPWVLAPEAEYALSFRLLQEHVYFNGTAPPNPIDPFYVYPGVEIRANVGPRSTSAIINPNINTSSGDALPPKLGLAVSPLELSPSMKGFSYVSRNMSVKRITDTTLEMGDLPCFIYGISTEDISAIRAWGPIHELQDLLGLYGALGFSLPDAEEGYAGAMDAFDEARYEDARRIASDAVNDSYTKVLENLWPYVEQGFENPRNSTIPMIILNKIYSADRKLKEGKEIHGRMYLLKALKDWSEIPEIPAPALLIFLYMLSAAVTLRRGSAPPSRDRSPRYS